MTGIKLKDSCLISLHRADVLFAAAEVSTKLVFTGVEAIEPPETAL